MTADVIRVERLSKKYILGEQGAGKRGLRHVIEDFVRTPSLRHRRPTRPQHDNELYALDDVSFGVERGDVFGIVGRNGSGKSTLLKILSRITEPTRGRIGIKGRVASLLEVGTGFHPELTGRENTYLNGAILGMTRAQITRRFDEIVAFAEIERFLDTPVKRYSSGMYLRLAFAVAAHLESELIVLDEVLAVGDAAFQQKCMNKMDEIAHSEGRTVLFVSHNMGAVQRLCRTALLLERGKVRRIGKPADVVVDYLSLDAELPSGIGQRSGPAGLAIEVQSSAGRAGRSVYMGEPLKLVVTLDVDAPVRNASVGIGIEAPTGERVVTFDTTLQHRESWGVERRAQLIVDWPECLLCPGTYRFVAALYDNGVDLARWYDAGRLTVLEADYFGTNQVPDARHQGRVFSKARWHITECLPD